VVYKKVRMLIGGVQACLVADRSTRLVFQVLVASRAAEMNEQASPLLGICASSVADGVRALREWTTALNTTMAMPGSKVNFANSGVLVYSCANAP
jgi:hypothetical protein